MLTVFASATIMSMGSGTAQIDRIVYTASLASRADEVGPILDPLRVITARSNTTELSPTDAATLTAVQQQLEHYLLSEEKVRLFTPESLKEQIAKHEAGDTAKKSRLQLLAIIVTAFTAALALALFLPLDTPEQRGLVGGATTFSLLTVGAASLFLTALPSFQSQLRRAFLFICAGVTLLGLSLLGQPVMEIFNLRQYPATSILYTTPIFIAAFLFHIGDAMFVRLVGVKSKWTGPLPLVIGGVIMIIFSCLIPHEATSESELVHDFVASLWGVMLLTPSISAIVLALAIPKLSDLYKRPITLLFQSMFPIIMVVVYQYVVRLFAGPYMQGIVAYVLFSFVTLMGLGLVRAGYSFNKTSRY